MSDERLYRKTIVSVKDANGVFVKQERLVPVEVPAAPTSLPPTTGDEPTLEDIPDFFNENINRCLRSLYRQVRLIEGLSVTLLSKEQAAELREYSKLLLEFKKRQNEFLDAATDAELEAFERKKKHDLAQSRGARPRKTNKTKKGLQEV